MFRASMSRATRISFGKGRACTIQRQAAAIVRADAARICTWKRYHPSAFSSAGGNAYETEIPGYFASDFA